MRIYIRNVSGAKPNLVFKRAVECYGVLRYYFVENAGKLGGSLWEDFTFHIAV
jgi:hypothetical protein